MENLEYANAYSEVNEILKSISKEDYEKIIEELIKLIDEGVYIVDKNGVGRFYNDIMASMEKVNMEDVLGKKYQDAFPEVRNNDSTMMKALFGGEATVKQQQSYKNFYGKEITTINSTRNHRRSDGCRHRSRQRHNRHQENVRHAAGTAKRRRQTFREQKRHQAIYL